MPGRVPAVPRLGHSKYRCGVEVVQGLHSMYFAFPVYCCRTLKETRLNLRVSWDVEVGRRELDFGVYLSPGLGLTPLNILVRPPWHNEISPGHVQLGTLGLHGYSIWSNREVPNNLECTGYIC